MKNARAPERRRVFTLGQGSRRASGIKRRCGRQHEAPAPSAARAERGRPGHALEAVLALLLFAVPGMGAAITGADARTPQHLSVSWAAARPTKTPPPGHTPTPTPAPSRTPAPAPSPTLTAPPTARATVPARATPPVKVTTPAVGRQAGGSQRPRPLATLPTRSPAVQQPSRVQQQGEGAFASLVPGILSGIAAVGLLVVIGRWLLRKWLQPVRRLKLPPSGATPWERVRPTGPQESQDSAVSCRQHVPTTDVFIPAAVKRSSSILSRQNTQPMAPVHSRESPKNAEELC